ADLQHGDGADVHDDAGVDRVVHQHQHVLRIAVLAEGVVEVAVVGRVPEGRVENAVEVDATRLVVDFVLHAAAARDLDDGVVCAHACAPWERCRSDAADQPTRNTAEPMPGDG